MVALGEKHCDESANQVMHRFGRMATPLAGGIVFTAGTTDWAHGLSGGDATVTRITRNLLDRLSK